MNSELAGLMEENLKQVWSERNAVLRMKAIEKIYVKDSVLFHVDDKTEGIEAINKSVSSTLSNLPEGFVFTKLKPVIVNNNIGRLVWGIGPKDAPPVGTGMDIAFFENGRIKFLYVFLDT